MKSKAPGSPAATGVEPPIRDRILNAAFESFVENGYAGASTLKIATRAKVSKRDLYAHFRDKHAMLAACISGRVLRMGLAPDLPQPTTRGVLAATLQGFGARIIAEVSHPAVIAAFRLAIAEAKRAPEVARAVDGTGREATRRTLTSLLARAQSAGVIGPGEPAELAAQYLALVWEGLLMDLLLGLAEAPTPAEIEHRVARGTEAFLSLHPAAG
jgi:AcrR family transcriptional regulator